MSVKMIVPPRIPPVVPVMHRAVVIAPRAGDMTTLIQSVTPVLKKRKRRTAKKSRRNKPLVSSLEKKYPYKDFNGKPYKFHVAFPTKSKAIKDAKQLREHGNLTRVICLDKKYIVFWRAK
jgi:hypothetical protein